MAKKQDFLDKVKGALDKKFGKSAIRLSSGGSLSNVHGAIPTGVGVFDHWLLGVGGLPVGKVLEVYGDPDVGKTSWLLQAFAGAQKMGAFVVMADMERTLQTNRVRTFDVDPSKFMLLQPRWLEECIDQVHMVLDQLPDGGVDGRPTLIGWDSLAATPLRVEMEGSKGSKDEDASPSVAKSKMGVAARYIGEACRVLPTLLARKHATVVFVNQTRQKIGVVYGNPTTTPGGQGPKFTAAVRLHLMGGKAVKLGGEKGTVIGKDVTVRLDKSKFVPPGRSTLARFYFDRGWDDLWSTIRHAKTVGLMPATAKPNEKTWRESLEALGWPVPNEAPVEVSALAAGGGDEWIDAAGETEVESGNDDAA